MMSSTVSLPNPWINKNDSGSAGIVIVINKPHDHDIIKGRGGGVNKHAGNVRFRTWVEERKRRYALSRSKAEKARVAQEVIDLVKGLSPPGRFLKMVAENVPTTTSYSSPSSGFWVEMDAETTMTKVSQALREGAPIIRQREKSGPIHGDNDADSPTTAFKQPKSAAKKQSNNNNPVVTLSVLLGQHRPSLKRPKFSKAAVAAADASLKQQQESGRDEQDKAQRSAKKRSKPNAAAAAVPGSATTYEPDDSTPEEQEQQQQPSSSKKRGLVQDGGANSSNSRKRSASTAAAAAAAAANNNKNASVAKSPPATSSSTSSSSLLLLLQQRLDQLEERQGDLESQLLEEKKQRLKQEQRQGALELQLLDGKTMRIKQDDVIKGLRRDITQLQQQQRQQQQNHSTNNDNSVNAAATSKNEHGDEEVVEENNTSHASVGTYVV